MSCGSAHCSRTLPLSSDGSSGSLAPIADIGRGLRHIAAHLHRCHCRQRQRRALLELDDRLLADIGITREQAEAEGRKPFWR